MEQGLQDMARKSPEELDRMERDIQRRSKPGAPRGNKAPALRMIRIYRDMTQTELAESSGVSRVTINKLEHGSRSRARIIRRLARALNAKPELLVIDIDNENGELEEDEAEEE